MKKGRRVRDVFFRAAAESALASFKKHGEVKVSLLALVNNKKEYELLPVDLPASAMDIRIAEEKLERALTPIVDYVLKNDARVVSFFVSATGQGTTQDKSGAIEDVNVVINAARTEENQGRTLVAKITGPEALDYEVIVGPSGDDWVTEAKDDDIPARAAQAMLSTVWMNYLVLKSIRSVA